MKPRFPLYLKIVLWFLANLVLLAIVGVVILEGKFGTDLLLSGPVTHRIATVSEAITSELRARPGSEWNAVRGSGECVHSYVFPHSDIHLLQPL